MFQLHLRDKNERLYSKLESLQTKLNDIAVSKRDISSNYVLSEEEKLKVCPLHPTLLCRLELKIFYSQHSKRYSSKCIAILTNVLKKLLNCSDH